MASIRRVASHTSSEYSESPQSRDEQPRRSSSSSGVEREVAFPHNTNTEGVSEQAGAAEKPLISHSSGSQSPASDHGFDFGILPSAERSSSPLPFAPIVPSPLANSRSASHESSEGNEMLSSDETQTKKNRPRTTAGRLHLRQTCQAKHLALLAPHSRYKIWAPTILAISIPSQTPPLVLLAVVEGLPCQNVGLTVGWVWTRAPPLRRPVYR